MKSISLLIVTALFVVCAAAQTRQIAVDSSSPTNITTTVQANWVSVKQLADTPTSFYVFDPRVNSGSRQQIQAGSPYTFYAAGVGFYPIGSQVGQIQLASGSGVFVITENAIGGNQNNPANTPSTSVVNNPISVGDAQTPYSLAAASGVTEVSCAGSAGTITINLPAATGSGDEFDFVNETPTSGTERSCIIHPNGTDTIGIVNANYTLSLNGIWGQLVDTAAGHWTVKAELSINNQGNQLFTGADVAIGSSYTQVFQHSFGTPSSNQIDSVTNGQLEFVYSGSVVGNGQICVASFGQSSTSCDCVIDFLVPTDAVASAQPFTVPFSCAAFRKTVTSQFTVFFQNVYVKTSLTGLTAKFSDIANSGKPSSYVNTFLMKTY